MTIDKEQFMRMTREEKDDAVLELINSFATLTAENAQLKEALKEEVAHLRHRLQAALKNGDRIMGEIDQLKAQLAAAEPVAPNEAMLERVSHRLGCYPQAWDCIDPIRILQAVLDECTAPPQHAAVDPNALARFIRQINGNNRMGAGALAENILEWLGAEQHAAIDMVLHCPKCGTQHIDAPEPSMLAADAVMFGGDWPDRWTNPPHRSHLCAECGCVWRPAR